MKRNTRTFELINYINQLCLKNTIIKHYHILKGDLYIEITYI